MKILASISGPDLVRTLEEIAQGNGWPLKVILSRAGVHNSYTSRWRRGLARPSQIVHDRISRVLWELQYERSR